MIQSVTYLYAVMIGLVAILATVTIWAPRKLWVKLGAVATAGLFMPVAYLGLTDLLSKPKPLSLEVAHRKASEADVIGTDMREGVGIYLWLRIPGVDEPRAYVLPWSKKLARELHGAGQEAQKQGRGLRMRLPFEPSLDQEEPKFYAPPQPAPPAKSAPIDQPLAYPRPS